jgi:apolipoprotein D and lipocalin family protein
MPKLTILLCLFVMACAAPTPPQTGIYRKADAPIWSNAQLDSGRLRGTWQQVAGFAAAPGGCAPGVATIGGAAGQLTLDAALCLGGRAVQLSGPLDALGPGRFRVGDQDWWVIWADSDYRTLAIGTPGGGFGFILNRGGVLPPDRLRAAREIFDFNGYDVARLQTY